MRDDQPQPTVRAGIYTRLSKDPTGTKQNIAGQERRCREMAARRGWSTVSVYVDRDRSATGSAPRRPGFAQMCADLRSGHIDGIVALDQDRLVREPRELEALLALCADLGVTQVVTSEGILTADRGAAARVRALAASDEIDKMMLRHRRKQEDIARAGKWGGGYRAFGYSPDHLSINHEEASLLRDAARRVIKGESADAIAREWNKNGVTTALGNRWRGRSLRRILLAPSITGLREHRGEIVATAVWPPILDRATWDRVRSALALRPEAAPGRPPREYLLTRGLAVCGLCGGSLRARPRADKVRSYVCVADEHRDGSQSCGGVRCVAEPLEKMVVAAVVETAATSAINLVMHSVNDDRARRAEIFAGLTGSERKLANVEERYLEGHVSRASYLRVRDRHLVVLQELRNELAAIDRRRTSDNMPQTPEALQTWWDSAGFAQRRALVSQLISTVQVMPASHRGARFSPERIVIVWAD